MLTPIQRRFAWIGGLALAAGGLVLALAKSAQAQTSSSSGSGSTSTPGSAGGSAGDTSGSASSTPGSAGGTTTVQPTVTPIASLPATGPNGCTWSTPATAPNDVYALAGSIANNGTPIPWQEGMSYGPVQMSDGNYWRFNMATGITNPAAPIHDILAQVCQ